MENHETPLPAACAAAAAAGDPNPGQGPVGDARLPDRAYRGPEQPLAVPDALLADCGADTGHAVFKLRLRPVLRKGQDFFQPAFRLFLGGGDALDEARFGEAGAVIRTGP